MSNFQSEYGPLSLLIGSWQGDKGLDLSPTPESKSECSYQETMDFQRIGKAKNAQVQELNVLFYKQVVTRKEDGQVFHHQVGYWMWDEQENKILHSFTIPRGVSVCAEGVFDLKQEEGPFQCKLIAHANDEKIAQSSFMKTKARTLSFEQTISLDVNKFSYHQNTCLDIYGKTFEHTDQNELIKIDS